MEKKIEIRQQSDETAVVVSSMPGAGAYSSLALSSRIGSIERFARPDSLANYWGLTPGLSQLGRREGPAWLDHETRQRDGPIHPRPDGLARVAR